MSMMGRYYFELQMAAEALAERLAKLRGESVYVVTAWADPVAGDDAVDAGDLLYPFAVTDAAGLVARYASAEVVEAYSGTQLTQMTELVGEKRAVEIIAERGATTAAK